MSHVISAEFHTRRIVTPIELTTSNNVPESGWYISEDLRTLVNIDDDGYAECFDIDGDRITLADGDLGTPWARVLHDTIGNQLLYRLGKVTIRKVTSNE
ncbi:hypothetical protein [Bifidobacterium apri]|uniref:Uncharacterized protein n=1 Tax=Bifidobacterium apri TaxID=1769423 RepID=A0A6A2W071_9BIFI|nr:hypothetical protein [Bifidobacterium apri]KAB8292067.1 hypothetical protein DSM100238_1811 [Bifidobacterium apri]